MRVAAAVLLAFLTACAGHNLPSNVRVGLTPQVQRAQVGQQVCFTLTILGPLPAPAVLEILEDDEYGVPQAVFRTIWKGDRQVPLCTTFTAEYFTARQRIAQYEASLPQLEDPIGVPKDIDGDDTWDGTVEVTVLLRAPRVDDFAGEVSRDELESMFTTADGRVYRQIVAHIHLSCNSCTI
jgi:hypothetical protein